MSPLNMRGWGFTGEPLRCFRRKYAPVNSDQSEPGTVLPQNHPLVVYFRGYCREKLGESGAGDYAEASRLSAAYVFPDTAEDFNSLKAALRQNENDASAHFLLGSWYFARGESDLALGEWNRARAINSSLPVLDASTGLALLHVKGKFDDALQVFEEGIKNDPRNVINYSGALAAATLLNKPPVERARIIERYPDMNAMPTALVYELALSRAEAGNYDGATSLFKNRFFGREEGGTNVRQVWVEVKLAEATGLGRTGHCREALAAMKSLRAPVAGVSFTENGMDAIAETARTNYLFGELSASCGDEAEAQRRYQAAAQSKDLSQIVWAWAAARKLPGFEAAQWQSRLASALSQIRIQTSHQFQ